MRALALLAAVSTLVVLAGCSHKLRACKAGTVLLTIDVPVGSNELDISVSIDGNPAAAQTVALPGSVTTHGTVELDFSAYPAGHVVSVTVAAVGGGQPLGSATSNDHTLAAGCDAISVSVVPSTPSSSDMAVAGGFDLTSMSSGDLAGSTGCGTRPTGTSCDTAQGVCTTACSASQPCSGGCCDGAHCVPGNTPTQCALGQALCGSCAGNAKGTTCLATSGNSQCGCTSASDCPVNQACDPATHTCGSACDVNRPCNGGCCSSSSAGACQTGTAATLCGSNGGVCNSCVNNQNGHLCIAITGGGQCGCNAVADCASGASSCSSTQHLCVNSCSSTTPCQSGCCSDPTNGTCQPGTTAGACGAPGALCQGCAGNSNGSACLASGACGCAKASDCPVNEACNTATGKCTTACGSAQPCNGGCCNSAGSCTNGSSTSACGTSGGACSVCPGVTVCAPAYSCDPNNGTCVPSYASSSTQCAAASGCAVASYCTGSSPSCPPQGPAPLDTVCAPADSQNCLSASRCNGSSTSCPPRTSSCSGTTRCCYPGCYTTCP